MYIVMQLVSIQTNVLTLVKTYLGRDIHDVENFCRSFADESGGC